EEAVDLGGKVEEDFVYTRFLHALLVGGQTVLDHGEDPPTLYAIGIQAHFPRCNLPCRVGAFEVICPLGLPFLPRRDMLADDLWTLLLGLRDGDVAGETEGAGWVVDSDEALPLLDGERFGGIDAQAYSLALGVEGVEVNVGDYTERAGGR
ncbi:hypothetical protein LTR75_018312, partial [Friedmanniomyces endolithicus]